MFLFCEVFMFFRYAMGTCKRCGRHSDGFEFKINPLESEPLFYCCCHIHSVVSELREHHIIKPDTRQFTWPELFVVEGAHSAQAAERAPSEIRAIGQRQREYFPARTVVNGTPDQKRLSH